MNSRIICQKGVSLVESLIALAILLFIMFTVFILLGSLISKGYTLIQKTTDSQNIRDAIEEFKTTGVLDDDFGKTFTDNPNNPAEYVIRIYSKDNSGGAGGNDNGSDGSNGSPTSPIFISKKPIAVLNLQGVMSSIALLMGWVLVKVLVTHTQLEEMLSIHRIIK